MTYFENVNRCYKMYATPHLNYTGSLAKCQDLHPDTHLAEVKSDEHSAIVTQLQGQRNN